MEKPTRRKNRKRVSFNLKEMEKERREYYEGLREIESSKKRFYKIEKKQSADNTTADEDQFVLLNHADTHPGKEIFEEKLKYQCFTRESLDYEHRIFSLQTKLAYHEEISETNIPQLFYIMSLEEDEDVCHSCYEILISNLSAWMPKLEDIFKIFFNWGASFDTFELKELEKSIIFPGYFHYKIQSDESITSEFLQFHYHNVFSYLQEVLRFSKYDNRELIVLLKYFIKITLDKKMQPVISIIKGLIGACIEAVKDWDLYKIIHISNVIHDENDHFHNQVAIVMDIIPKKSRSKTISSCLSFSILRLMIENELQYQYPYEEDELLKLIQIININPDDGEDLYKLYIIIHLLNHMLCQWDMADMNPDIFKEIIECVEGFKWDLSKSTRVFDAHLLKGRISYCSAMWSLMYKRSSKS